MADDPIICRDEDAFGWTSVAEAFAEHIMSLDKSKGLVVGVLGSWGSGKTSFVNLARCRLEKEGVFILDFNPWMFSGPEQLVNSFFVELAAQLKVQGGMEAIGKDLEEYGEIFSGMTWIPVVGPWVERGRVASKALAKILQRRKGGVHAMGERVKKALRRAGKPIAVVIDDIDRLSASEIRDVFKLVRLTASFPNVVYIVSFDRSRVETALKDDGIPGRDYLEKILQVAIDVPSIPTDAIRRETLRMIDSTASLSDNPGPFDDSRWPDAFAEIIMPLVRNMRDVRRYAATIHGTLRGLEGNVALVDVLSMEAVRLFLPQVFEEMRRSIDALTGTARDYEDGAAAKERIGRVIDLADGQSAVVHAVLQRLFPAANRHRGGPQYGSEWKTPWLKDRRVAHADVLHLYFERVVGDRFQTVIDAEQAWSFMNDPEAFRKYIESIDPRRVESVIGSLEMYQDDFNAAHLSAVVILLDMLPRLPERPPSLFSFGPEITIGRVVLRVLRKVTSAPAVERAVREALPKIQSLYSQLFLIDTVGHRENVGHKLVASEVADELAKTWRSDVRRASSDTLIRERRLLDVLLRAQTDRGAEEPHIELDDSPEITYALLRSAWSESISQEVGSRAVKSCPYLRWDSLVQITGGEDSLKARIVAVMETGIVDDGRQVLELAKRYMDGYRPDGFG